MTQLSVRSRVLTAVAALLMLAPFFLPLWRIDLKAPQYPEGLGMLIRVNTITGLAPTDLNNINGLNHYIGMKAIEPESIPVLRYMPWVAGALAALGFATALIGRRKVLMAWIAAYAVAGAAGLVEFYVWSYDYGHNLAADAVIKVPGMSYQPPLLGSKQLLNFTASSWPASGGWLAAVAFVVAVLALLPFRRALRVAISPAPATSRAIFTALAFALLSVGSCRSAEPTPLAYGRADCDVCRMRIADERYGGELITKTGKVRQFDAIECLATYAVTAPSIKDTRSTWVSDFDHPGQLVNANTARFVTRAGPGSQMGAILAVGPGTSVDSLVARFGTTPLTWDEVLARAERGTLRDRTTPDGTRAS
ncbi:MAG: hypothetical protein V4550_14505 [Gemmatimonadota bacterium]